MRITGYKLLLLVSYIIVIFFNLATLYQLSNPDGKSTVTTTESTQGAERTFSSDLTVSVTSTQQTSTSSYIIKKSDGNNKNRISEVKTEISRNNSLYYSALPGTNNSWTLFDIRRGSTKNRLEIIGIRLIIVDRLQVNQEIFMSLSYGWIAGLSGVNQQLIILVRMGILTTLTCQQQ